MPCLFLWYLQLPAEDRANARSRTVTDRVLIVSTGRAGCLLRGNLDIYTCTHVYMQICWWVHTGQVEGFVCVHIRHVRILWSWNYHTSTPHNHLCNNFLSNIWTHATCRVNATVDTCGILYFYLYVIQKPSFLISFDCRLINHFQLCQHVLCSDDDFIHHFWATVMQWNPVVPSFDSVHFWVKPIL